MEMGNGNKMENLEKILVIEDNPEFRKAAQNYFESQGISVDYAIDYVSATSKLLTNRYNGIITDCFFPKEIGDKDISLGKEAVNKMIKNDKKFYQFNDIVKMDSELSYLVNKLDFGILEENILFKTASKVSSVLGREKTADLLKKSLSLIEPINEYGEINKAMEKSEYNQPLGILIGKRAEIIGTPFVLATSTYHHDKLTNPINDYCNSEKWILVDTDQNDNEGKRSKSFWEKTYSELNNLMKKQNTIKK